MPPSSAWRLDPFSQGSFHTCERCGIAENDPAWLGADVQVLAKFDGSVAGSGVGQAWLALARLSPPVAAAYAIDVYGYGSAEMTLVDSDQWAGAWLGRLQMPAVTSFGEIAYFDATTFVRETAAPYLTLNLRASGGGFGEALSLQLVLTPVPEPGGVALMLAGLLSLAVWLQRRASEP